MTIIWDEIKIDDILTVIISAIALIFSIAAYMSQKSFNKHSLTPACKIDVFSINDSLRIIFRNVGNGVMNVKKISYYDAVSKENIEVLSDWLKDCPYLANSECNLDNTWLGTSMSYNLLFRKFAKQEDLDCTWEKLKNLRIDVEFKDTFNKMQPYSYSLDIDYKIYTAAKGDRDIVSSSTNQGSTTQN